MDLSLITTICFTPIFIALAIKRLDWALMLILATLPSYQIRFQMLGIPFTLLEVMILIAFTVWFSRNYKKIFENIKKRIGQRSTRLPARQEVKGQRLTRYPYDVELALLLIISWIAALVAGFSDSALGIWKAYFFEPVLLYILIVNVFGKYNTNPLINANLRIANNVDRIMWPLTISAFWVSGAAIVERLTGLFSVAEFWPRVTGPFLYPNALGLYLGPLVVLMIGWLMSNFRFKIEDLRLKNYKLIFLIISIILSIIAIVLARSEGAIAGFLIALVVMGLFGFIQKPKLAWLPKAFLAVIMISVLLSSVFFLYVVPAHKYLNSDSQVSNYIFDKLTLKDISGEIRKEQWRETFKMLKGNGRWLWGAGLSNYKNAVKPYHQEGIFFNKNRDPDFRRKIVIFDDQYRAKHWQPVEIYMYPHNILLNFWTELGLVGMFLFVWVIGKFLYLSVGALRATPLQHRYIILGLMGAMVVVVVHGIVDVPYFKNDLAVLFWVLFAILAIIKLTNPNNDNEKQNN